MPCSRISHIALRLAICCTLIGVAGCGSSPPPTADLTGTIKIKGKAPNLEGLEISFLTVDGRLNSASVAGDGTYKTALPAGEVKIGFVYTPYVEPGSARRGKGAPPMPGKGSTAKPKDRPVVPNPFPDYLRDPSTSNLKCNVEAGKNNVFDYDLRP